MRADDIRPYRGNNNRTNEEMGVKENRYFNVAKIILRPCDSKRSGIHTNGGIHNEQPIETGIKPKRITQKGYPFVV